ncbi:MAG: cupin domain-containing protein [Candidatus Binataceae bacterium]
MTEYEDRQALRPGTGEMVTRTIADEARHLKAKPEWQAQDRLAISLVKDDALNVLLMVLKEGAHLAEHRTKGPIVVQVVSGRIRFLAGGKKATLAAGSIVALDRGVAHSLESLEESAVLLTTAIE